MLYFSFSQTELEVGDEPAEVGGPSTFPAPTVQDQSKSSFSTTPRRIRLLGVGGGMWRVEGLRPAQGGRWRWSLAGVGVLRFAAAAPFDTVAAQARCGGLRKSTRSTTCPCMSGWAFFSSSLLPCYVLHR